MLQREIDELLERKAYDIEFRKKFNQELNTTPRDFTRANNELMQHQEKQKKQPLTVKTVKTTVTTPQAAAHAPNTLSNIFSPQDLSHSVALNPGSINFLTPATTTWKQSNLTKLEETSSPVEKDKLVKNADSFMSHPAQTTTAPEDLSQDWVKYQSGIKSEAYPYSTQQAFSMKSDPRKVHEAMRVTNSFKTTSFEHFENRGNIEDKLNHKFRFNNVTKKYVEKLSATMTCLKVKQPKIDQFSLTGSLNTCRQSPRYKEITVSTFLSPGKTLNVSQFRVNKQLKNHLVHEQPFREPEYEANDIKSQLEDLERQLEE